MKKLFTLVILLSIGITQIYAQQPQPCLQCTGTTALGNKATSIGTGTAAGGENSFAGGYYSLAPANNSFAFGNVSKASGLNGIAFGNNAQALQTDGIAIGSNLISNAANSLVFGTGSSGSPLVNKISNSIMFGVTNLPSLTIAKYGNSDRGYLGIGTDAPQEMAHVVGTLLIERTEQTASSLQFKHPKTAKGNDPGPGNPTSSPYFWDIYSDAYGLKFNMVLESNNDSKQAMVISKGGYVGIGITNPQAKLHVDKNILAEGNITTLDKFVLTPASNATSELWEISRTGAGLNFAYKDNGLRDVLFMSNNGSIGIGTINPAAMFDVNGALKATSATIPTITGNTNVTGTLTANALTANSAYIKGALDANSATIAGPLVANSATIYGATIIKGALTANSAKIEGALSASSATINGQLTANSATIPTITGNTTVTGTISANLLKAPSAKINGLVCANEVRVQLTGAECWPDFVFGKDYKLLPLKDVEQFIMKNQHLPNVPSSAEVEANGVELGAMNAILLQKVEELTLYILDLQKQINELKTK